MVGVRRRALTLVLLATSTAVTAVGCSVRGSDYQYLRSRSTGTYLRLPQSWKVADVENEEGETEFGRHFDGFKVDLERSLAASTRPGGYVRVRALAPEERDVVSFEYLRNVIVPVDELLSQGVVEVLDYEPVEKGEFRGNHMTVEIQTEDGPATVSQAVMVDRRTTRVHTLLVGCSSTCFEEHKNQIKAVIESLTVKET